MEIKNAKFSNLNKNVQKETYNINVSYKNNNTNKSHMFQRCLLHSKTADLICKQQGQFICPSCALFGLHKGHNVIAYDQLLKSITDITDQTYKIYDIFKEKSQNFSKQKIQTYIQETLRQRRDIQARNIRAMFQKLIQTIRKVQKATLNSYDALINKSIKNLKQNINTEQFDHKKQEWVQQIYSLTSIMDNVYEFKQIKKALRYLNQNCQESFLTKNGEYLLVQLNSYQSLIKKNIDDKSQALKCNFDQSFFKKIENFCIINSSQNQCLLNLNKQQVKKEIHRKDTKKQTINIKEEVIKAKEQKIEDQDLLQETIKQDYQQKAEQKNKLIQDNKQVTSINKILYDQNQQVLIDENTNNNSQYNSVKNYQSIKLPSRRSLKLQPYNQKKNQIKQNFSRNKRPISTTKKEINLHQNQYGLTMIPTEINFKCQRKVLDNLNENGHKRNKKLDIPQKYRQIWQDAKNDKYQMIDLTNAQLGDSVILSLIDNISKSQKIRYLKLIRNKITDESIFDIISNLRCTNIISLNLSQNNLTDKTLQIIQLLDLGNIKTITLSLNKINARKVKDKIEMFKDRGITLSI